MEDFKIPVLPASGASKQTNKESDGVNVESTETTPKEPNRDAEISNSGNNTASQPVCPYKVPPWSQKPPECISYKFEVLKSGQIIDEFKDLQKKAFWKFGRLPPPANDLELGHPTISRFHAILQYRPKKNMEEPDTESNPDTFDKDPPEGWYIYDLNSTHGTFLNKQRIPPKVFIRIRVGHMLRLGASTRSYILQGPEEDAEPESELTVTELREQHRQKIAEAEAEAVRKAAEAEERERNEGISWGMAEDADEETDLTHNPYASTNNEELFLDDPKKTLRGYFEREGLDLVYKCDEMSAGSFVCRVELPLDDAYGRPIIAEVVHKGRKKECVVQCALEACRILDRHGVLRQANQEPLKRKVKPQSDSDDDDFLDRTGDVERKKLRKSNPSTNTALTYDDLLKKETDIDAELEQVEENIEKYLETQRRLKASQASSTDDLDDFMETLTNDVTKLDKTEIRKLRLEQQRLNAEKQKNQRLMKIAKPVDLIFDKLTDSTKRDGSTKRQLPMVGKRNQFSKFKIAKITTKPSTEQTPKQSKIASDEEEFDEDDETSEASKEDNQKQIAKSSANYAEAVREKQEKQNKDPSEISAQALNHTKKMYGPAALLPENYANGEPKKAVETSVNVQSSELQTESDQTNDITKTADSNEHETSANIQTSTLPRSDNDMEEITETENSKKKRRQRQRQRQKRQDVDVDELEEHESSEKYAKWVPPTNQSGDGYTELNEKYGY